MNIIELPPDVRQNLYYTLYFIVFHNFQAIVYATGIIIALLYALYRPSRATILLLLGFVILLFNFEYNKHIADALREQTLNSLVTVRQSAIIPRLLNIILIKLPRYILPLLGWGLIIIAFFIGKKTRKNAHI